MGESSGSSSVEWTTECESSSSSSSSSSASSSYYVREVWASDVEHELRLMEKLVEDYPYVAVDGRFPGLIARPTGPFKDDTERNYEIIRTNMGLVKIIQLSLAFSNKDGVVAGHPEDVRASHGSQRPPPSCVWKINFHFDVREDMYCADALEQLRAPIEQGGAGIDLNAHLRRGVSVDRFSELITGSGLVMSPDVTWITVGGGFLFAGADDVRQGVVCPLVVPLHACSSERSILAACGSDLETSPTLALTDAFFRSGGGSTGMKSSSDDASVSSSVLRSDSDAVDAVTGRRRASVGRWRAERQARRPSQFGLWELSALNMGKPGSDVAREGVDVISRRVKLRSVIEAQYEQAESSSIGGGSPASRQGSLPVEEKQQPNGVVPPPPPPPPPGPPPPLDAHSTSGSNTSPSDRQEEYPNGAPPPMCGAISYKGPPIAARKFAGSSMKRGQPFMHWGCVQLPERAVGEVERTLVLEGVTEVLGADVAALYFAICNIMMATSSRPGRSDASPMVFVLPLRKRVLFPGLRAQALVHESVYDAFVAHQKTLSPENALGHAKLVTVGCEARHSVGTLCRMASSSVAAQIGSGDAAGGHQVVLTLEGLDRVELDTSAAELVYEDIPGNGNRSVVYGKARVSQVLRSIQKGPSEELEMLAADLQRKVAELFQIEKRIQSLPHSGGKIRAGALPGPLGGLVASLWNGGRVGEGGEKEITEAPIKADRCSLFADIICATLKDVPIASRQKSLECLCIEERVRMAGDMVDERREAMLVSNRVRGNIRRQADMDVRERVIRRQIQELQKELRKIGGEGSEAGEDEIASITNKLAAIALPKDMRAVCDRELHKLQNTPSTHPDYTVSRSAKDGDGVSLPVRDELYSPSVHARLINRTYLETVASLPWSLDEADVCIDLDKARYILDRDHFGMSKKYGYIVYDRRSILPVLTLSRPRRPTTEPSSVEGVTLNTTVRSPTNRKAPPGPVMCLVGPPGVGKTSLCRSIADALGKKFCRVSLGGVRDEAEIRGHRRTYIGAMLGTVLQELARCGSRECVMLLDEIDKVAQPGFNSNAQAALLELLDPSQHSTFRDHYLGVPFDLSCITFICTANSAGEMSRPLIDRLEMVELASYTLQEKREIAKRHLVPRQLESHCLPSGSAKIEDGAIDYLVECYTKEAGVRFLAALLLDAPRPSTSHCFVDSPVRYISARADPSRGDSGDVCRYTAVKMTEQNGETAAPLVIRQRDIPDILGPETFESPVELARRRAKLHAQGRQVGVALGLAVTAAGGDVLEIESTITSSSVPIEKASGSGKVAITGQLGKVMQESVSAAIAQLKARVNAVQDRAMNEVISSPIESIFRSIDPKLLTSADVHVHFPAGAVPKDGPSAGVAVFLALVSLFSGLPIPPTIATTGEITLTGQVLPVGGVRDKVLAAQRAGVDTVIMPRANAKTLRASLPLPVTESMDLVFIDHVDEALLRVFKSGAHYQAHDGFSPYTVTMLSLCRGGGRGVSRICLAAVQATAANSSSRKFVVPVGTEDVEGTAAAIRKAVDLARDGDIISCVHVPRPFPEYLLSSMSDPGAVSPEGEALFFGGYLKSLFEATGPSVITKIRKEVEELSVQKSLQTECKLLSPSNNVKVFKLV
ncbi:hypothetical protein FOZ60_007885 [Perkinsus olseni]|uniref:Lon proteolytic domain-containing protein n=1 Tax=Perkinsus olseni TaxID=32597 RepID=A0A7J6NL65_PEROL|nr:hypothetical protein FOZ60_007885 [Perkinsus olseni]